MSMSVTLWGFLLAGLNIGIHLHEIYKLISLVTTQGCVYLKHRFIMTLFYHPFS